MPLSEHEQKILAELEESLSKQDPRFAKNVRDTNVYSHGTRRVRWGIAGFVVGLVTAAQFIRTGAAKNVVVIGADALSRYVDWRDRGGRSTVLCKLIGEPIKQSALLSGGPIKGRV